MGRHHWFLSKAPRNTGAISPIARLAPSALRVLTVSLRGIAGVTASAPALRAPVGTLRAGRTRRAVASRQRRRRARDSGRGSSKVRGRGEGIRGHGRTLGGHAPPGTRVAHLFAGQRRAERQLAEAHRGVLDAITRLAVRVTAKPRAPALLFGVRRGRAFVERVAVLEMHVGFVDGLKARPACKGAEGKKE
jgi:hypothetical protein